jgi:nucleoside transporter
MSQITMTKRVQLSAMMFLQYMLFAAWWNQLAGYLANMGISGRAKATIMSSMALGSLLAPIIGMFADRHFASQKLLAFLNILCAVLLFLTAQQTDPTLLFIFLLLAMFCYMPTWSLTNAVAMAHSPAEVFPQIRMFGTIGWIAAALFSIVAKELFSTKIDGTAIPFLCGAATAVVAAIVNFTLPHTPPQAKGQKASVMDALGLRAMGLMKDWRFAAFLIISTLIMVPFSMYFSYASEFFTNKGYELITAKMSWGQVSEMVFMPFVGLVIVRMGIKKTIVIGMTAQIIRYIAFWCGGAYQPEILYYLAILIHGIIFGCIVVGGQMFVNKKAPAEIRAQGQGMFALMVFGVGMLIGTFFNGMLIDIYSTKQVIDGVTKITAYDWDSIWMITTVISTVLLLAFLALFREDDAKPAAQKV